MEKILSCPFCGSENYSYQEIEHVGADGVVTNIKEFECNECHETYDEDVCKFEQLRHRISGILMDTDEDNPRECDIIIEPLGTFGLSTNDMPRIVSAYQIPVEGIICFNIAGSDTPLTTDDVDYDTLKHIYEEL